LKQDQRANAQFIATHNYTWDNVQQLHDMRLQTDATRNEMERRESELIPGGLPIPNFYREREATDLTRLGRDQLRQAEQAYQQSPSYDNWVKIQDARQGITEQHQWMASFQQSIVGFNNFIGKIAPITQTRASQTAVKIAQRDNGVLQDAMHRDPSEDNWWNLRINRAKLDALRADVGADQGATAVGLSNPVSSMVGYAFEGVKYDEEERDWRKVQRLTLQNLQRQRAEAAMKQRASAASNSVQSRMLALTNYGPAYGPPVAPAYGPPFGAPGYGPPVSYPPVSFGP